MTKQKQYGLKFLKFPSPLNKNSTYHSCVAETSGTYDELQILRYFTESEATRLIAEIQKAQNGESFEESIDTQWSAVEEIIIHPPVININDVLTIPMQDMKELLLEWVEFVRK